MSTVFNATSHATYSLLPNEPLIIGRRHIENNDKRVSRDHVKITLLEDGRCFVQALGQNRVLLDNALLPESQKGVPASEIEAFDQQWIHLLPGQLYPFQLTLAQKLIQETPRKPLHPPPPPSSLDSDDMDAWQSEHSTDDEAQLEEAKSSTEDLGYVSTESSLIGESDQ
ncbi:hypothetical protein DM01DRAFT_1405584 [Hesseltinella vesiculosa]|uniref:FHA domain-containing protein n=1 Tax=Hesseltinella vesiculosa TaxID=101127 RepID=A0A1X2GQI6_9FUNG|nr:hypothetical protein DM01DRAFT_1405584 [Hesseltinella vesiculosa]